MKLSFLLIVQILYLFCSIIAHAEPTPVILNSVDKIYEIGKNIEYLRDPENKYTLSEILTEEVQKKFVKSNSLDLNFRYTNDTFWFRFKIINKTGQDLDWFFLTEYPNIDQVYFYEESNGSYVQTRAGILNSTASTEGFKRGIAIKIHSLPETEKHFLFKTKTQLNNNLFPKILSKNLLQKTDYTKQIFVYLYLGIMLAMAVYNAFIFLSTRLIAYLYYIIYIIGAVMFFAYIEGLWAEWFSLSHTFIYFVLANYGVCIGGVSTYYFTINFLEDSGASPQVKSIDSSKKWNLKHNSLLLAKIIFRIYLLCFAYVWIFPAFVSVRITAALTFCGTITMLTYATIRYLEHNKNAKYYILSWGIFFGGTLLYTINKFISLPINEYLTSQGVKIGAAVHVLILSFALANRINIEKREKEKAQQDLVRTISDLDAMNHNLENVVNQRTQEVYEQQMKTIAAAKMATLGEMAGGIAHEINNPIAIIDGLCAVLETSISKDKMPKEKVIELLGKIRQNANRIAKIIKSMRIIARDGTHDPLVAIKVNELLSDTIGVCREKFLVNGIDFKVTEVENIQVFCRHVQIAQVLLNLLNNAYDAVSSSPKKVISLEVIEERENILFIVSDSGGGIAPEHLDKIFQPFFTTKEIGKGTGIGLSISQSIAHMHDGDLSVKNIDNGAQFTLRLPKANKQPSSAGA